MAVAIAVQARLFARLRELAGTDRESLALPDGATLSDAFDALARAHPGLESHRPGVLVALNQEFSSWDAVLADGDEVAFIPPVTMG